MKKLVLILLIVALVLVLGACNSSPDKKQPSGSEDKQSLIWHGGVLDADDPYYADGLNDFGLPDLSRYSIEQIWNMYEQPEKWDVSVLDMADTSFDFDESEPYSDPEYPDYVFDLGDWHDYDTGTWTPGPDWTAEFDIDWSAFDEEMGEYDPSVLVLPDEYAFLVPGGVRSGDMVINDEDGLQISLQNRTANEYADIVNAAKDHGYTIDAETHDEEVPMMGRMRSYSANNGTKEISIAYQNSSVTILLEDIESDVEDFDEGADED